MTKANERAACQNAIVEEVRRVRECRHAPSWAKPFGDFTGPHAALHQRAAEDPLTPASRFAEDERGVKVECPPPPRIPLHPRLSQITSIYPTGSAGYSLVDRCPSG